MLNDFKIFQHRWFLFVCLFLQKEDWGQKNKNGIEQQTEKFPYREKNFQLGSKDLGICFWLIYKFLCHFSTHTREAFRCMSLKIWKQNRSEIPSLNPLLPLSNYRLPGDKLQVWCVCLCLLKLNRWKKVLCMLGWMPVSFWFCYLST